MIILNNSSCWIHQKLVSRILRHVQRHISRKLEYSPIIKMSATPTNFSTLVEVLKSFTLELFLFCSNTSIYTIKCKITCDLST